MEMQDVEAVLTVEGYNLFRYWIISCHESQKLINIEECKY